MTAATSPPRSPPRRVVVIGAGIVGLSCAWWLQRQDIEVVVLERGEVGAGASAANAGWISPGLSGPLASREAVRAGGRGLWDPRAPVVVPPAALPRLVPFLAAFLRNSGRRRVLTAVAALEPINNIALGAYQAMVDAGVDIGLRTEPIVAAFHATEAAARLSAGLADRVATGRLGVRSLPTEQLHQLEPALTASTVAGLQITGQRWLDPLATVQAIASAFVGRGGVLHADVEVDAIRRGVTGLRVHGGGREEAADAVVVATGAWAGGSLGGLGVRVPLTAGRGYSMVVRPRVPVRHPLYLPTVRLACTPEGDRLRVTGIMELGAAPRASRRRLRTMLDALRPYLEVDDEPPSGVWSGPRPLSADGLPLIGRTREAGVYVAAGHGMYGMTLGPATGQLLAELMVTDVLPAALATLRPTRASVLDRV